MSYVSEMMDIALDTDLRTRLLDHIRLRQDQRDQVILGKLGERIVIHPILESHGDSRVNHIYGIAPADNTKFADTPGGG